MRYVQINEFKVWVKTESFANTHQLDNKNWELNVERLPEASALVTAR